MKTTIDIPDRMLRELLDRTGAETKRDAVLLAIEEYNRRRRMADLVKTLGTFEDFMSQSELDTMRAGS